ncbi:MAG: MBL fold metallo-hydrolase [Lachnospiraceae bacterium]|jgi:competence protein ComEC|nr:MBL fold metallo-hydrolase [Lachnospiraceae bacterium]
MGDKKMMIKGRGLPGILLLISLLLLTGCGHRAGQPESQEVALTFIHVGKGDALLLSVPGDGYYLVDTGKEKDFEEIQEVLDWKGVEELKGIFISHGHKDHAGGLKRIVEEYPVGCVYMSGLRDPSFQKINVREVAQKAQVSVKELFMGDVLMLGKEESGVQVQVLGPEEIDEENENNNSLILRVVYKDTAFLLMGDTELASEERLLCSGAELQAFVLKLGHHGKMDATSEELLQRVRPSYGIVTANRKKEEGAADPAMAERLLAAGVEVYYSEGKVRAVDFISDGTRVWAEEY